MNFTDEQALANRIAQSGLSLKIIAPPGSGKTTQLIGISQCKARNQRGLYVSFSADNKNEAKLKLPKHIQAKTGHGLAWSVGERFSKRLNERLTGRIIVEQLRITPLYASADQGMPPIELSEIGLANLALDTVTRFCQTADQTLSVKHLPIIPSRQINDKAALAKMDEVILFYAQKLWSLMSDPDGTTPSTHDVYLKLWALSRPKIPFDYILQDEFQDTNDVLLDVVLKQNHAQLILVGDPHQSIFQWRGAVNALDRVKLQREVQLTQSFRFGQAIADVTNNVLTHYKSIPSNIKGLSTIESRIDCVEKPNAYIARTNATLISVLLEQKQLGLRVGIAGGTDQAQTLLNGIADLKQGGRTTVKELSLFRDYEELMDYSETKSGQDLKSILNQMNKFGMHRLKNAIADVVKVDAYNKQDVDVVLTTAHRSKGLEWDSVKLCGDFRHAGNVSDGQPLTEADANLLYVAVSRAKKVLDISECEAALIAYESSLDTGVQPQ